MRSKNAGRMSHAGRIVSLCKQRHLRRIMRQPQPAELDLCQVVHVEHPNGNTSDLCLPRQPPLSDFEMCMPAIPAWMKQADQLARGTMQPTNAHALVPVAVKTRISQVRRSRGSIVLDWDNVFHLEGRLRGKGRQTAIFAAMPGPLPHLICQSGGNAPHARSRFDGPCPSSTRARRTSKAALASIRLSSSALSGRVIVSLCTFS